MIGKLLFVMERWCDADPSHGPTNSESQLIGAIESTGLVGVIKRFYFDVLCQQMGKDKMGQVLLEDCQIFEPDLVIYTPIQGPLGGKLNPPDSALHGIRSLGIKVHTHLWDTVADDRHVLSRLPYSDCIGVVDSVVGQRFGGEPRIVQSYAAVDPKYFHDKGLERDIDVSFVGPLSSPSRISGINFLKANGVNVTVAGGQRASRLSWEEYARILQRSKISLNFSRNPYDGTSQMKARALEVMTCGAMLIEEDGEHTKRFFEPGKDYVMFHDQQDLLEKVRYYLAHEEERKAIAKSGWEKATSIYNALNCWADIFQRLGSSQVNHCQLKQAVSAPLTLMNKVLITGITGFVGSHLADYLSTMPDWEIHGIVRERSDRRNLKAPTTLHMANINDTISIAQLINELKPDYLFHLAAQSFVPLSFTAPYYTIGTNVLGTLSILDAIRVFSPETKALIAGTSEEYGYVNPDECPISETQPLRPQSPYAVSKVATDLLAQQYTRSYGLHIVVTRAFNHTGPRRGEHFVTSKIAKRLAEIEKGKAPNELTLGNLEAIRDFTDVRDMVKAYWLAIKHCPYGIPYNIGSGHGHSIAQVVEIFRQITGVDFDIKQDSQFMRPSDVPLLICDNTMFKSVTGWKPEIHFRETLRDLYEYWLEVLSGHTG